MSTPPEHAPTEPVPNVASTAPPPATSPPTRTAPTGGGPGYDPVARIALVIIAAIMVIFLIMTLVGYNFHVTVDKGSKDKEKGGKDHSPKVTQSANP